MIISSSEYSKLVHLYVVHVYDEQKIQHCWRTSYSYTPTYFCTCTRLRRSYTYKSTRSCANRFCSQLCVEVHEYICRSEMNSAKSKIFDFFFFLHSYVLWDETRHFLPQLALCCDCVRCY